MNLCIERCSLGFVLIATDNNRLFSVELDKEPSKLFDNFFMRYPKFFNQSYTPPSPEIIEKTLNIIDGGINDYSLTLDPQGTEFQNKVWDYVKNIPLGHTRSYKEVAFGIGRPQSFRAVANACGRNPLEIIIPCHRVIASNEGLGGYHWGVKLKRQLLEREKAINYIS